MVACHLGRRGYSERPYLPRIVSHIHDTVIWQEQFENKRVYFWCDNEAVIRLMNKQTSLLDFICIVCRFVLVCLSANITLLVHHITGMDNNIMDSLSHL